MYILTLGLLIIGECIKFLLKYQNNHVTRTVNFTFQTFVSLLFCCTVAMDIVNVCDSAVK